jgi:hypothetical protein
MIQNTEEIKSKIVSFLKQGGPSLPIHISREIQTSMLFASAFLSEMVSDKRVKISHMRVGGSPVYLIQGQEPQLEKFSQYLNSKEKEAYSLLKQKRFLKDSEQEPAIRVALRAIRDFAIPFKRNDEIYWKYLTENESEFNREQKQDIQKPTEEKRQKEKITVVVEEKREFDKPKESEEEETLDVMEKEKPLIKIKESPKKRPSEKSEFVTGILEFLRIKDIEIMEEILFKKKEFEGIVRINSDLGKIEFFTIGKDKKVVTENDLRIAVQKSQSNRKPVLFISTGNVHKKAKDYLQKYESMIKFLKVNP